MASGQPHIYIGSQLCNAFVHHLHVICGPAAQTSYHEAPFWHEGSKQGQEEGNCPSPHFVDHVLSLLDALSPGLCGGPDNTHPWLLVFPMPSPASAMLTHTSILS